MSGLEIDYIKRAHQNCHLAGDGEFTKKCQQWLEEKTSSKKALLTHSCTAALEMAALLLDLKEGDEVIMPSYTFVSTANAFVLRGATPVFVDIRKDTLNIDESLIEAAITDKTKAIVPVHYAGVACEMDTIMEIANSYNLAVVEDAAQGILSSYKGKPLGSIGDFGTLSFHETKNIISGEGGALLINNEKYIEKAEIIREKGTDRSRFFRGQVDKYTWQSVGSSYLPSELVAAFLFAQFNNCQSITNNRLKKWHYYDQLFQRLEIKKLIKKAAIPNTCQNNGHIFYIILNNNYCRSDILKTLREDGVDALFHYIPLHSSPAGIEFGRQHGKLENTTHLSEKIIRLPLWTEITKSQQEYVYNALESALTHEKNRKRN